MARQRVAAQRRRSVGPSLAIVFCRTGSSKPQEQQVRSILPMNRIAALDVVLPQKDGFIAVTRPGAPGGMPRNRSCALCARHGEALLAFIEAAAEAPCR